MFNKSSPHGGKHVQFSLVPSPQGKKTPHQRSQLGENPAKPWFLGGVEYKWDGIIQNSSLFSEFETPNREKTAVVPLRGQLEIPLPPCGDDGRSLKHRFVVGDCGVPKPT